MKVEIQEGFSDVKVVIKCPKNTENFLIASLPYCVF